MNTVPLLGFDGPYGLFLAPIGECLNSRSYCTSRARVLSRSDTVTVGAPLLN